MEILPWRKTYVRAIDNVIVQTWLNTYPNPTYNISQEDIIESFGKLKPRLEYRKGQIESAKENEIRLIAKEGNSIVGICVARKDNKKNELEAIYILPGFQKKGIGKKLWEDLVKGFFDQGLPVIVEVAIYNKNAISFYSKLGFHEHTGEFHIKNTHSLKNGKSFPVITMILPRIFLFEHLL